MAKDRPNFKKFTEAINPYPFFCALSHDTYLDILFREIVVLMASSDTFSPSISVIQSNLGHAVAKEIKLSLLTEQNPR